ncbi:MAG: glycosyltransferase family 2 protein [Candidatus Brocadiales bacterium]|nr:glycosyltransferase family 2 protein [Candidatus Brocadiales bacterium]
MIKASVIIPTYNRGKLLCNTLATLIGQLSADVEIVVVDQSDEVCSELMEITKNRSTQIHYYKIFVKGLPHARNFGLRRAIGEIIIFCDDDVVPGHNFIKNHLQNYTNKDVGGVGGRILPNRKNAVAQYQTGKIRWWDAHLIDNFDATTKEYIEHAQGCNMSFRKEAVVKAGGFDERFGGSAHLEETDLCLRIRKDGYKIVFDPKAELIHLKDTKGGCRAENYKQWFYWYGHNNMLFFLKNFNRYLFPAFVISSFTQLILSACKRCNPMIVVWGVRGYKNGLTTYKSSGQITGMVD